MENLPPAWTMLSENFGINPAELLLLLWNRITEKWVKHYSSNHRILLVGEGDFSFSLSLALGFGSAFNIVATSLDSYDALIKKYRRASSNLVQLRALGATVLHEVDATQMQHHIHLQNCKFDRIVFNFPHAGFLGKEDDPVLIKMHKKLIHDFFSNARRLLQNNGEIHVNHNNKAPYCHWNLQELARENSLVLIECVPFDISDYPHYQNKRGDGWASDDHFFLGDCSTFKFAACPLLPSQQQAPMHHSSALNPVVTWVKFIVKGLVQGGSHRGPGGYAGALFNSENSVIAVLYGPLQEVGRNVAELIAVKEALLMFERSKLFGKVGLVVESHSKDVVSWIKCYGGSPMEMRPLIKEIVMAVSRMGSVDVRLAEFGVGIHHPLADGLVALGANFDSPLEFWF